MRPQQGPAFLRASAAARHEARPRTTVRRRDRARGRPRARAPAPGTAREGRHQITVHYWRVLLTTAGFAIRRHLSEHQELGETITDHFWSELPTSSGEITDQFWVVYRSLVGRITDQFWVQALSYPTGITDQFWAVYRSLVGRITDQFWMDYRSLVGIFADHFWSELPINYEPGGQELPAKTMKCCGIQTLLLCLSVCLMLLCCLQGGWPWRSRDETSRSSRPKRLS